ncbi:MAG: NUDIX domain-containing protein [Gammaproteobacteria bacterium]|uniref:ADP-ribose pyrophosphatase YjhB (NUDIX family) n=1 Tax=Tolumonas osonensis TaxID=675874 RepID=A0A841GIC2_9GAMM|nr:NUDIX domain-containing protein [Tolumonas osonensis]MBB6054981.1 ADP-ribose pyrophosphatase YjhB (NUDIX family) [Tolumonas osonensis]NCB60104.1 NUDIX domain-containing protein [Gammaproteobacteria bacterium]
MNMHFKPRRATCIVECDHGILLTDTGHDMILLPGGQANRGESRLAAAIRELKEETNLQAHAAIFLFDYESRSNRHKVFYLIATGTPIPMDDAKALYYSDTIPADKAAKLSPATKAIMEQFKTVKAEHQHHLDALREICLRDRLPL